MVWNSEGKGGLSILEFPKARGRLDEDSGMDFFWNHPIAKNMYCQNDTQL